MRRGLGAVVPTGADDGELRAGLKLLPPWALAQKAAANRRVITIMAGRLERGEPVVSMYGPLGLAFLQTASRDRRASGPSAHLPTSPPS